MRRARGPKEWSTEGSRPRFPPAPTRRSSCVLLRARLVPPSASRRVTIGRTKGDDRSSESENYPMSLIRRWFPSLLVVAFLVALAAPAFAAPTCGNGVLDAGEQCDPSVPGTGTCCKSNCTFLPSGTTCRAAVNGCDIAETCSGTSSTCPTDAVEPAGFSCTDDGNPCTQDVCNGSLAAPACLHPAGHAGASCTDDGNPCTLDVCDGNLTTCTHPVGHAGTQCRASAGQCDVAEFCDGVNPTCPVNDFASSTTHCTGSSQSDACDNDAAEHCTGTSNTCVDVYQAASVVCHVSAGVCDTTQNCTGTSATCPSSFLPSSTVCRPSADVCDKAENCTGTSAACPTDTFQSASTACRAAADVCDAVEKCTGTSAACPADGYLSSTTVCRASVGVCDVAETCTGTSTACPTDAFASSSTVCRASAGVCDVAENCTGTSSTCPTNAFLPSSTICRASAGVCDPAENCTGSTAPCPTDAKSTAGTTCPDDGNPCSSDVCDGTSNACTHPAGNAGATCPADGDACTTDTCNGTSTTCQHAPGNAGAVCRPAANDCDVPETCPAIPVIGFRSSTSGSSGASTVTSFNLSKPAGTAASDVMVASVSATEVANNVPTITPPTGWTLIASTDVNGQHFRIATFWRLAGSDAGPYTFTVPSASAMAGGISAYANVDTTNPINASGGAGGNVAPSITTTVADTMLVACFGRSGSTLIGVPSGMTERFHAESSAGDASESADAPQAAIGATGSKSSTGTISQEASQLIALAPLPDPGCPADAVKADGSTCNDSDLCTRTDTCQSGVCVGGNPVTCTALDQCHVAGTCDPASGACSNPSKTNGSACNDGNACTQTDTCQSGVCAGSNPVACSASDQCHNAGTCDPATGTCSNPAKTNGSACNDGNDCTQTDTCQSGSCVGSNPVVCSASDQCHTAGTCNTSTGVCSNPNASNGTSCSDGNACTGPDTCSGGTCGGPPVAGCCNTDADCDDHNLCTTDSCDVEQHICNHLLRDCNNGDVCDGAETCEPTTGECVNDGIPLDCDDGVVCTHDTCDPQAGCMHDSIPNCCRTDADCNDHDACTGTETCEVATGMCHPGTALVCDDGDPCNGVETCDPAAGCQPGSPLDCADHVFCTADSCVNGVGCTHTPIANCCVSGADCDDGNFCNGFETCVDNQCTPGTAPSCDDHDVCTDDSCDPQLGCLHVPNTDPCDDGVFCNGTDTCSDGMCTHSGDPCTGGPECDNTCDEAAKDCHTAAG